MVWNLERWLPKEDYNWLHISNNLDRIETVDDMTVAIHFTKPTPTALTEFTYVRPVRFLSPKAVDADGTYAEPVGTGPWKIEKDAPEGTETWFVSVKSDQTWRTLAIPFDRFDSVEPVSDHRLDLNAVEAIVLLVDTGAADPGTR